MVASPAASPHDSDTRPAAHGVDPAATPALPFDPSSSTPSLCHSVTASLLSDLASPHHSLSSVAEKHNLSLSDLLAWLELPSTREQMAIRESACYHHVRYVAALNLSQAVHTTVRTLDAFNKSAPAADPLDPSYLRAAIQAHKAAWLLYRFSRLTPVTQADLDRARSTVRLTSGTARQSVSASPVQPPRASTKTPPVAAVSKPAPTSPPAHAPAQATAAHPANSPDPRDRPQDMAETLNQLTALATFLGIDIGDLEDLTFDPEDAPINQPPGHAPHRPPHPPDRHRSRHALANTT